MANETTTTRATDALVAVYVRSLFDEGQVGPVRLVGGPLDGTHHHVASNSIMARWPQTLGFFLDESFVTYERMTTNRLVAYWRPSLSVGKWAMQT